MRPPAVTNWEGNGGGADTPDANEDLDQALYRRRAISIDNDGETERDLMSPIPNNEEECPPGITTRCTMYNTNER
jgi:hypothetical protein